VKNAFILVHACVFWAIVFVCFVSFCLNADQVKISQLFDPVVWESSPEALRSEMVEDLLKSHNFVGQYKDEVEKLLGSPDDPNVAPGDFAYKLNRKGNTKGCLYFAMQNGKVFKVFVSHAKVNHSLWQPDAL
jgi:hypothetical protein